MTWMVWGCVMKIPTHDPNRFSTRSAPKKAVYAGTAEAREWGEDAQRISREASDADHFYAERFMLLYENQDLHGPVEVVIADEPTLDRLYQVLPQKAH